MAAPGALAFLFGWLAFRSRVTGVYFSIISQAMTFALMLAFFRNDMGFGGNNGLTDFKEFLGLGSTSRRHPRRPHACLCDSACGWIPTLPVDDDIQIRTRVNSRARC